MAAEETARVALLFCEPLAYLTSKFAVGLQFKIALPVLTCCLPFVECVENTCQVKVGIGKFRLFLQRLAVEKKGVGKLAPVFKKVGKVVVCFNMIRL